MTSRPTLFPALTALLTLSAAVFGADVPEGKDHPLIKRYEGSTIHRYSSKAFDEYVLPLGPSTGRGSEARLTKSARLEGRVTRITYMAPLGRSTLEVVRNYESELKNAGYTVLFAGSGLALGADAILTGNFATAAGYGAIQLPGSGGPNFNTLVSKDQRFLAAKLTRPEGDVHVVLYAAVILDYLASTVATDPVKLSGGGKAAAGQVIFQVDVVEAKPMESRMVTVLAADMAAGIASSGSVALYGILFDTNSAEIKPESTPTLQEIAKLLKSKPTLKLLVVGHTDNVGAFESNMGLSQRRAASVVKTLSTQHGVDVARLTPVGVSFASPVASNKTEEGKAKNRRVQLVEQ
jgi:OmpA-OmpF porin, OOP family